MGGKIDSLTNIWIDTTQHDTIRLNAVVEIIWDIIMIPPDSPGNYFIDKYAALINELEAGKKSKKYQSIYYCAMTNLDIRKINASNSKLPQLSKQKEIDFIKSEKLAKEINFQEGLVRLYLSRNSPPMLSIQKTRFLFAYKWAKRNSNKALLAEAAFKLSRFSEEIIEQKDYLDECFKILEELRDTINLYDKLSSTENLFRKQNPLVVLEYLKKAESLETIKDKYQLFTNITNIYLDQRDGDMALIYSKKALKNIQNQEKDIRNKIRNYEQIKNQAYLGLIEVLIQQKDTTQGLFYIDSVFAQTKNFSFSGNPYKFKINNFYGQIYFQQKKYKQSIKSYKESIIAGKEFHNFVIKV